MSPDQDQWAISLVMPNFCAITYVVYIVLACKMI